MEHASELEGKHLNTRRISKFMCLLLKGKKKHWQAGCVFLTCLI